MRAHRVLFLLAFAGFSGAEAQSTLRTEAKPPRVLGVYGSEGPLANAIVFDMISGGSVRTTESGAAPLTFARVQNDTIVIRVLKLGYRDTTFIARMGPSDTLPITILLSRVIALPTIEVTALRGAMSERVRYYGGKEITPEELHKPEFRTLSMQQILERTGINYMSLPPKARGLRCAPRLLVNGTPVNSVDLRTDSADMYEAVEYYPDRSFPIEFGAPGMRVCGLLILWTKPQR